MKKDLFKKIRKQIVKKARMNKDTSYLKQLCYICEDGYKIQIVKTSKDFTLKEMRDMLVERVLERYPLSNLNSI